jgi:hypothetical protein
LAFLTVIDLSVRADVSRADTVLACLVTRVGMSISRQVSPLQGGFSARD